MKTIVKFLLVAAMGLTTGLVSAKLFGKFQTKEGVTVLFDNEQRWCPPGMMAAEVTVTKPKERKLKACWVFDGKAIRIQDEEGDGGFIDPNKVEELKNV